MGNLSKLVELFVVASILQNTAGLQCPSCSHVTAARSAGLFTQSKVDNRLKPFQNVKCSQELTGRTDEIKEDICEAESGKEARCSWYRGTLTLKLFSDVLELPFLINKRGCYYAESAAVPANGCHDFSNLNEIKSALDDIIDEISSSFVSFQGQRCLANETYGHMSSAVSYFYKLPLHLVIGNVLVMFVLKYV